MIENSNASWGWPAKLLHWIGAILILLLLGHGWWMTHLAPRGPVRLEHYAGHAGLGYDFLALLVLRLLWRWTHAVPDLPATTPRWERLAAHFSHYGLYILMFATTVVGWALAGTMRGGSLNKDAFGFSVPIIFTSPVRATHELLEDTHKVLAYLLLALVVVHVIAALRHHFGQRDDVLRRMWFGSRVR
jgi:cytochrome b561